jgi:hypothetical protein
LIFGWEGLVRLPRGRGRRQRRRLDDEKWEAEQGSEVLAVGVERDGRRDRRDRRREESEGSMELRIDGMRGQIIGAGAHNAWCGEDKALATAMDIGARRTERSHERRLEDRNWAKAGMGGYGGSIAAPLTLVAIDVPTVSEGDGVVRTGIQTLLVRRRGETRAEQGESAER